VGGDPSGAAADTRSDSIRSDSTIHASAVLVGTRGLLIRGDSGAGKSQLTLQFIAAAVDGRLPFARLVADDRVFVTVAHGRLIARPPRELAGLIEIRGLGIRRLPYESAAVIRLVVDLAVQAERLPPAAATEIEIEGVRLPRLAVAPGEDPFSLIFASLTWGAAWPDL
jgi:serine kinase of HPr protein (carbohydrate metabolism regulator)